MHHRNIKILATELYKFVNGLSPRLVSDCFKLNNMAVYNTRNRSTFYSRPLRTVLHDAESLSNLGPKIWKLVPSYMKKLSSLTAFKKVIKQWKPHACPRRLCRTYIYQVGFVIYIYIYIYIYVIFNFILLEHYLLQFYISFYTSVN